MVHVGGCCYLSVNMNPVTCFTVIVTLLQPFPKILQQMNTQLQSEQHNQQVHYRAYLTQDWLMWVPATFETKQEGHTHVHMHRFVNNQN